MKFTLRKDFARKATSLIIEIDDSELASVHLSPDEIALVNDADPDLRLSDRLVSLGVLVRKIEQTVLARAGGPHL